MAAPDLDPRFTFESFVVGAANRLAVAAARRVAEAPGTSYNPLFIYSASGLGKTHLLTGIGHHARRVHSELNVVYDTLERFMDEVMAAIEKGASDAFRARLGETDIFLLDDVQFLAGRHRTQEELLRAWDGLAARGGQIVLASDRPPTEIDSLDDRLLSRLSGGLIIDIAAPDYETRVAIVRRKTEDRGQVLSTGVAEAIARSAFANVRELQGALNRVLAVQELEGRILSAEEVPGLLGRSASAPPREQTDEFGEFLADIAGAVSEVVEASPAERQLAEAILRWESEGYRARRLESALADPPVADEIEAVIRSFEADVERLREVVAEIAALDPGAPELRKAEVLRDPDRLDDAHALLGQVRERMRPLPPPPDGYRFDNVGIAPELLTLRAAESVAERPGEAYNPLFIHGPAGSGKTALLAAIGCRLLETTPDAPIAFVDAGAFATELIEAIERNRLEGWRERYRRARVLLFDGVDALAGTERAQDELFLLFDAAIAAGAQIVFTARRAPEALDGIEERLRSRMGSGLVVEMPAGEDAPPPPAAAGPAHGGERARAALASVEKVAWAWPYLEDVLIEDPD